MRLVKLVFIGEGAIGKTCVLISYTTNSFPSDYVPTVFDNYNANVMVDGKPIALTLWDTAGQSDYDRLRPLSYPATDVFLVGFSLLNRTSYQNLSHWVAEARHHCPEVPIMLVGTKLDLRRTASEGTYVTREEGEDMQRILKLDGYMECSALTQENLRDLFDNAIRLAIIYQDRSKPKKSCSCCSIL